MSIVKLNQEAVYLNQVTGERMTEAKMIFNQTVRDAILDYCYKSTGYLAPIYWANTSDSVARDMVKLQNDLLSSIDTQVEALRREVILFATNH